MKLRHIIQAAAVYAAALVAVVKEYRRIQRDLDKIAEALEESEAQQ